MSLAEPSLQLLELRSPAGPAREIRVIDRGSRMERGLHAYPPYSFILFGTSRGTEASVSWFIRSVRRQLRSRFCYRAFGHERALPSRPRRCSVVCHRSGRSRIWARDAATPGGASRGPVRRPATRVRRHYHQNSPGNSNLAGGRDAGAGQVTGLQGPHALPIRELALAANPARPPTLLAAHVTAVGLGA